MIYLRIYKLLISKRYLISLRMIKLVQLIIRTTVQISKMTFQEGELKIFHIKEASCWIVILIVKKKTC